MNWRTWSVALLGYWLMLTTGLLLGIFDFKWEVTLGDIALSIIASIVSIAIGAYRFWLPRFPFNLRFYDKPWNTEDDENISTDRKIIHCKRSEPQSILIGVQLRTQRTFKTVDIRLVERKWWFWSKDLSKDVATITAIRDQERSWAIQCGLKGKDNKKGGREASYEPPIDGLPRNTIMWYEVTAVPYKDWNGLMSFQLRRGSSHK